MSGKKIASFQVGPKSGLLLNFLVYGFLLFCVVPLIFGVLVPELLGLYNAHHEEAVGRVGEVSASIAMLLSTGVISCLLMCIPLALLVKVVWLQRLYLWAMLPISFLTIAAQVVMYREFGSEIDERVMGLFQGDIATLWVYAQKEYCAGVVFVLVAILSVFFTWWVSRWQIKRVSKTLGTMIALIILVCVPFSVFLWKDLSTIDNFHPTKMSTAPVFQIVHLGKNILNDRRTGYEQILLKAGHVEGEVRDEISRRLGGDYEKFPNQAVEKKSWLKRKPSHVFMFLLEAMDYDLISEDRLSVLAPNLNYYSDTGIGISNFMASGGQTIDAVHSFCGGTVMQAKHPRVAEIQKYQLDTLPKIMKRSGYDALFYAASFRKFLSKGDCCEAYGYDRFLGCEELEVRRTEHEWGVCDREFFDWVEVELSDLKSPHFVTFLNVSNHCPYEAPLEDIVGDTSFAPEIIDMFCGLSDKEKLNYAKHVLYADEQVGSMARYLYEKYPNALFVFMGDHNGYKMRLKHKNHVPFILWNDNVIDSTVDGADWFGSHMDVPATLAELVLEEGSSYRNLGRPLWDLDPKRVSLGSTAILTLDGKYTREIDKKEIQSSGNKDVYLRASAVEALSWGYTHLHE